MIKLYNFNIKINPCSNLVNLCEYSLVTLSIRCVRCIKRLNIKPKAVYVNLDIKDKKRQGLTYAKKLEVMNIYL